MTTKKKRQTNENYVKMTTPKHDAETWRRNINIHPRGRRRNYVKSREIFNISNAGNPAMWPSSFPWKIPWNWFTSSPKDRQNITIMTHERSVSRWRQYHKISSSRRTPKNPVKLDGCPYNATHPDRREIDRHLYHERKLLQLTEKFVKSTNLQL